jgi:acyl-CoA dehydrogenase
MRGLPWERTLAAAWAVTAAETALAATIAYAQERTVFGKPLLQMQNTRFTLAELQTEVQIGRVFVDRCIELILEDQLSPTDASMAKLWCSELQFRVIDACVKLHGGYGYMRDFAVARAWADAAVMRLVGGSNEIMKELIARGFDEGPRHHN